MGTKYPRNSRASCSYDVFEKQERAQQHEVAWVAEMKWQAVGNKQAR